MILWLRIATPFTAWSPSNYGLSGRFMRERVELLGGTLEISAAVGEGTHLHVELPVQAE